MSKEQWQKRIDQALLKYEIGDGEKDGAERLQEAEGIFEYFKNPRLLQALALAEGSGRTRPKLRMLWREREDTGMDEEVVLEVNLDEFQKGDSGCWFQLCGYVRVRQSDFERVMDEFGLSHTSTKTRYLRCGWPDYCFRKYRGREVELWHGRRVFNPDSLARSHGEELERIYGAVEWYLTQEKEEE